MSAPTFVWRRRGPRINSASAFCDSSDDDREEAPSSSPATSSTATVIGHTDASQTSSTSSPGCSTDLATVEAVESVASVRRRGVQLAELGRYWEALSVWNSLPDTESPSTAHAADVELLEMMAQVQLELAEIYPALESAIRAHLLRPLWAVGVQTLARTLMHVGEPGLAKRYLSVALRLQPDLAQLKTEDLPWCCHVLADACRRVRSAAIDPDPEHMETDSPGETTYEAEGGEKTPPVLTSAGGVVSVEQSDFICAELGLTSARVSLCVPHCFSP